MTACRLCGNREGNADLVVPEVMAGTGESFPYVECGACGSVQIREIPDDLARHYPADYYAFGRRGGDDEGPGLRAALLRVWIRRLITGRGFVGGLLARRWPEPPAFTRWLRAAGADPREPVLDLGCGDGSFLRRLRRLGFRDLTGVDPHLPEEAEEEGLRLVRGEPDAIVGTFDLVMTHHSLEHAPDPAGFLAAARRRLAPGGRVLVRLPVVAEAFRVYRERWAQLDAPRHLHLPTRRAFRDLAARAGLAVAVEEDDSTVFQVAGSERAMRGVPLLAEADPCTPEERAAFTATAADWRARGVGDSALFVLVRA